MSDSQGDPKPLYSNRVEQHLIGCLLRDPAVFDDVRQVVGADDFQFDRHQRIFREIESAIEANGPSDAVAIHDRLKAAAGGVEEIDYRYLAACRDAAAQDTGAVGHAGRIREYAVYRRIVQAANEVLRDAIDQAYPAAELAARAEQRFLDVSDGGGAELVTAQQLIDRRLDLIDAGGEPEGLRSGLTDLDAITGGFSPEELVIIGARPSKGKSALGLTVSAHLAAAGTAVLFVSLEMGRQQIGDRLLSMRSGVQMRAFTGTRRVPPDAAGDLVRAARPREGAAPIYVYDRADATPAEIASVIRRAARRLGVGLAVVDYLQLVRPTNPRDSRVEQVADISRRLKIAARHAGIPLVCLAQLNRKSEDRKDQVPKMSDLREGGSLEQDADKVILIHHPEADEPEAVPGAFTAPVATQVVMVELLVEKNRNGPTGIATVAYRPIVMRFENAARDSY